MFHVILYCERPINYLVRKNRNINVEPKRHESPLPERRSLLLYLLAPTTLRESKSLGSYTVHLRPVRGRLKLASAEERACFGSRSITACD